ncbi:MAG: hypothetical protein WCC41_02300 [Rhodomicrobium sp.]
MNIYDGLKIWLYSDTYQNRKLDPSVFQGIVRFNEELGEFEIEAKESDMVWLSESEQFKDYSIEDVIGKEMCREAARRSPVRPMFGPGRAHKPHTGPTEAALTTLWRALGAPVI